MTLFLYTSVPKLQNVGLLMETDVVSPDQPQDKKILWQFVHLSLQEFLAMAGLLNESPEKIAPVLTRTMTQLSRTGQYNMALLFLYGMAFDEGNSPITNISKAVNQSSTHQRDVRQILLDNVGVSISTCFITLFCWQTNDLYGLLHPVIN